MNQSVGTIGHVPDLSKFPSAAPYILHPPRFFSYFFLPLRHAIAKAIYGEEEVDRREREEMRRYFAMRRTEHYRIKEHRDAKSFIRAATRPLREILRQGL